MTPLSGQTLSLLSSCCSPQHSVVLVVVGSCRASLPSSTAATGPPASLRLELLLLLSALVLRHAPCLVVRLAPTLVSSTTHRGSNVLTPPRRPLDLARCESTPPARSFSRSTAPTRSIQRSVNLGILVLSSSRSRCAVPLVDVEVPVDRPAHDDPIALPHTYSTLHI